MFYQRVLFLFFIGSKPSCYNGSGGRSMVKNVCLHFKPCVDTSMSKAAYIYIQSQYNTLVCNTFQLFTWPIIPQYSLFEHELNLL